MKRIAITLAAAVLGAAAIGYGGYWLGTRQGGSPAIAAGPAKKTEKKVLYYHDPMVPGPRFDKPGRSPFMAMDLVPMYADENEQRAPAAGVAIPATMQQNLGLRTAEVMKGNFASALQAVGNVAFDERALVQLQARSAGFVEKVFVRAPLEPVRAGQPLLQLYSPDWIAVQEDYLAVRAMPAGAASEGLAEAAVQRMRLAGMNDAQVAAIVRSGKVNARLTVAAPVSGVVTTLSVREGMTVAAGAPLFDINGLAAVWINAEVPESAAAAVRPGAAAQVSSPAFPGEHFDGKVEALLPQVDAATRTLKARIVVANPQKKLAPGMFATIALGAGRQDDMLSVPSEAVIQTGSRAVVIVVREPGRFESVDVVTGRQLNGQTEILKGLEAGQKIVASGQFLIDSEASLRGTLSRVAPPAAMNEPAAPATHHAHGKIERIGKDEITLSHGPIPSLKWGPMTMGFIPPEKLPADLKVGDTVDADITAAPNGKYRIVGIVPATPASPSPHAGKGGHR